MRHEEEQYLNALDDALEYGEKVPNRTGTPTRRIFDLNMKFDLSKSFPLLTTKRVWFKGVAIELLWFLSGSTNIKYLVDNGVNIWNDDAYRHYTNRCKKNGSARLDKETWLERTKKASRWDIADLGPVYGKQWRRWETNRHKPSEVDQVANIVEGLRNNPFSRRYVLSAWNVGELDEMGLPPCHFASIFSGTSEGKLNCKTIIRSNDAFLGAPFNIASYALFARMMAQVTGLEPGMLYYNAWDFHIYENHIPAVKEQLQREPYKFPQLKLNPDVKDIDDFKYEDIEVVGYKHHPKIKAELVTG